MFCSSSLLPEEDKKIVVELSQTKFCKAGLYQPINSAELELIPVYDVCLKLYLRPPILHIYSIH